MIKKEPSAHYYGTEGSALPPKLLQKQPLKKRDKGRQPLARRQQLQKRISPLFYRLAPAAGSLIKNKDGFFFQRCAKRFNFLYYTP